jgi:ectoine hydroxylase-related dioxygenase (phytanoyl-CoA dioxygenase family)
VPRHEGNLPRLQGVPGDAVSDNDQIEPYFDEAWYLEAYPDVAKGVGDGVCASGWEHYTVHGKNEGRKPHPDFDAAWYARAYPLAVTEAGSAEPGLLERHYINRGRYRGYLPGPAAPRTKDAAACRSGFGGLWIDAGNALDVIAGRRELGLLSEDDATLLETFVTQGYAILPNAVDAALLDRAEEALDAAYDGKFASLRFECHSLAREHVTWVDGLKTHPAKAIDLHWFSEAVREAIFCPAITRFLHLIFERPALASQTLAFYLGSGQELHQDSAYVAYSLPQQFAASWLALEDVARGAGELEYLVDSHRRLPEFTYGGAHKSVSEAQRAGSGANVVNDQVQQHVASIEREGTLRGLKRESFLARRGDALLWHSDLAHGGSPVSANRSRKSLVTHYCPREVAPLFFETGRCTVRPHGRSFYTSGAYGHQP